MPRTSKRHAMAHTTKDRVYVGLDVHKKSIHVAVWKNGALADTRVAGSDYHPPAKPLEKYRPALHRAAYEAGPTGFAPARLLEKHGFKTPVCAPSKTPTVSADEAKCDRPDARKTAEYAAKELLTPVTVPDETEENERARVRHRDHLAKKLRRAKQQIKSALLFHQCGEPTSWSVTAREQLLASELPDEVRFVLASLLRELTFPEEERNQVDGALRLIPKRKRNAVGAKIPESHPGVGKVAGACFVLELFRPRRFKDGDAAARFVGLAPRVRQSGEKSRGGPLSRSGRDRLRALPMEAAWRWRTADAKARAIYARLVSNTGNGNKAIAGLARRLAVRLWTMWTRGEMYAAEA